MSIEIDRENKPIALFLMCDPKTDYNGTFSEPHMRRFYKIISETHHCVIQHVADNNIKKYIDKASVDAGRELQCVFICGHGDGDAIRFGTDPEQGVYAVKHVKAETFARVAPNGHIYSLGCCNGRELMQEISRVTKLAASGCTENIAMDSTLPVYRNNPVSHEERYALISLGEHLETFVLKPHAEFRSGIPRSLSFDGMEMLRRMADKNNSLARSIHAARTDNEFVKEDSESLWWFYEAAEKGEIICRIQLLILTAKGYQPRNQREKQILNHAPPLYVQKRLRWIKELLPDQTKLSSMEKGNFLKSCGEIARAAREYLAAKNEGNSEASNLLDSLFEENVGRLRKGHLYTLETLIDILEQMERADRFDEPTAARSVSNFYRNCHDLPKEFCEKNDQKWSQKADELADRDESTVLGDFYLRQNQFLEAAKMYIISGKNGNPNSKGVAIAKQRLFHLCERCFGEDANYFVTTANDSLILRGIDLFERALRIDDLYPTPGIAAAREFGKFYLELFLGNEVLIGKELVRCLRQAISFGDPESARLLGEFYENQLFLERMNEREVIENGRKYYQKAVELGDEQARSKLHRIEIISAVLDSHARDPLKIKELEELLSQSPQGQTAFFKWGALFERFDNLAAAAKFYLKAIDLKNSVAEEKLRDLGKRVLKFDTKFVPLKKLACAIEWHERVADDPQAVEKLTVFYETYASLVDRKRISQLWYKEGVFWLNNGFREATSHRAFIHSNVVLPNGSAEYTIGLLYANPLRQNDPPNFQTAAVWMKKAAAHQSKEAVGWLEAQTLWAKRAKAYRT